MNTKKYWKIIPKLLAVLLSLTKNCFAIEDAKSTTQEISDWDVRLQYAKLLGYQRHYEESLAQYRRLLEDKPDSVIALSGMAEILYFQGKHSEALAILEKIPENKLDEKSYLLMGDIALSLQDYPKAESIFSNHLKKFHQDSLTKFKLAELLSWQKRYDESLAIYRELLAEHPNDIQLRRKYATLLMWMGNEQDAAEEFKKTLEK